MVIMDRLREAVGDPNQVRPRATKRDNIVMVVLSIWFVGGLMIDSWAHSNLSELETFFTPWHAAFYTGFTATAAWVLVLVYRNVRQGRWGIGAVPVGYGWTVVGLAVFALSGVVDGFWHTIYGVETTINILFSPSHLGLGASMVIVVTSPLRAIWSDPELRNAPSLRDFWPAALSTGMATVQVLLFFGYGDALTYKADWIVWGFSTTTDGDASSLAARMLISNVVLIAPLLFLARRWRLPLGTVTIVWLPVIVLAGALTAGENLDILLTFLAAAICVDLIGRMLVPTADRKAAYWAFAGLAGLLTWYLYIGVASVVVGHTPGIVEMWTGAPIVAGLVAWLLAVLLLPEAKKPVSTECAESH